MVINVSTDSDITCFFLNGSESWKLFILSGSVTLLFRADFSHNRDVFHEFQHILGILHRFGRNQGVLGGGDFKNHLDQVISFQWLRTVCPRSLDPINIVTYNKKLIKTSKTYSIILKIIKTIITVKHFPLSFISIPFVSPSGTGWVTYIHWIAEFGKMQGLPRRRPPFCARVAKEAAAALC